jgi:4-hydroxy-4-methyl-2-oxoglutarate aldolase
MKAVAVRRIQRASPEVIARLGSAGVATVHEAQGRSGLTKPYLRPAWSPAAMSGSAVTVLTHPGDNWMLHVAVELCSAGDVLVVAVTSDCDDGMFGELLATSLAVRGVVGLVIDAGVRDVSALRAMRFPAWSRAVSARGTVKATLGSVNIPVIVAGTAVNPGDVVVADDDGVVFVPRQAAGNVADACDRREEKEAAVRERLRRGELGLDIYDMRGALAREGLEYVDETTD